MSPLFMDTSYVSSSPGSLSAEENHSQETAGPESRDGLETGKRGKKRQEKNRDAARKSRRKQTERADELHEELQCLEQSNSALRKEITALKKDYDLYTSALERHKPFCRVHDSASSPGSTSRLSPPVKRQASSSSSSCSSSPRAPHQIPASPHAAGPSQSTSSSIDLSCQIESPHLAPSARSSSSVELFSSPHSLFAQDALSLNPSGLTKDAPVRTPMAAALLPSLSTNMLSVRAAPSRAIKVHQLPPGLFRGNHINSNPPRSFFKSTLPNPASPSLPAAPRANPESSPASGSSYSPHSRPSPTSLLSLLTTPSPLNVSQTASSCFDGRPSQPLTSQHPRGDPLKDLYFTELLEGNDWILDPTGSGPTNQ
ncbi:uncharacterized protein V6R79_020305 [Siganus canaliculatus]